MNHLATKESKLTTPASTQIAALICQRGPLRWSEVMALALYDEKYGYYGRGVRRIGRQGDFFTAVSVGGVYGALLAEVAQIVWRAAGEPQKFIIAEQAGHDGQLAEDIWRAAQKLPLGAALRWIMIEPQEPYREAQTRRLRPIMGGKIEWLDDIAELSGQGLLLCNELLDALPVNRVRWDGSQWLDCCVTVGDGGLGWQNLPCSDPEVGLLPKDLPDGFTTETHGAMAKWAADLAASDWSGAVLIADYGYDYDTYYAPERSAGTLRRYSAHGCDGEVLVDLGECDLTAHINFSRLADALAKGNWRTQLDLPQGRFLTRSGIGWLTRLEEVPAAERPALLRQFQALTHPSHMGGTFRMLLSGRGLTKAMDFPTIAA